MAKTKIEWSQHSWNPTVGCSKISTGCKNCYAEAMARRLKAIGRPEYQDAINGNGHWTGQVVLVPERLEEPLRRRKPTTYFVNSMSDLFHENLAWSDTERVFMVMTKAYQHTFQVLTKRPDRMAEFVNECFPGLAECSPHIQLGASIENQEAAYERIRWLLQTNVAVRFLSCEPLLESVVLPNEHLQGWYAEPRHVCGGDERICYQRCPEAEQVQCDRIHWVVIGGESGPNARPMQEKWAIDLVRQCQAAGVPVFVKQMGSTWAKRHAGYRDPKGADMRWWPAELRVREFPRARAFRATLPGGAGGMVEVE